MHFRSTVSSPKKTNFSHFGSSHFDSSHFIQTLCTIPILVEFDRPMSVSSSSGADVDMRVSSKHGIVEVESEPSWMRMSGGLNIVWTKGWIRMSVELSNCSVFIKQGWTNMMLSCLHRDGCWRTFGRKLVNSGGMVLNRVDSWVNSPLIPRPLLARRTPRFRENGVRKLCWYVVGPLSDLLRRKNIDRVEYKKVANELLSCLPHSLQNNVVVRAPFAANFQISFGLKDGGGWDSCRAVQEALIGGVESNMISVRGHELKVSIGLSPRKKVTMTNMFRADSFLKKSGVNPESHLLCRKSSRILSTMTKEDLGETPKGSNVWMWHSQKCSECGLSLAGWESFEN